MNVIDKKDYCWLFYSVCVILFFNFMTNLVYLNNQLSFDLYIFLSLISLTQFIVFSYIHYELGYKLGYKGR